MSFEKLLEKLTEADVLAKALPAGEGIGDDKKIQAAAADGAGDDDDDDDEAGDDNTDPGNGNGDGDDKPMAKSFMLSLDDGSQMEAFDGTEMIKSLTDRLELSERALATNEEQVLKSLNIAVDMISAQSVQMKDQGALIKSLQNQVTALSKSGRGRTSTLVPHEKPALEAVMAKSHAASMGRDEILAKSLTAMQSGRITGLEASGIENRLNMNIAIDPALLSRIAAN